MEIIGADPLSRFLNAAKARPFAWGEFDCLLWLADWVAERTGIDPAADLRGTYATLLGAARIVKGAGSMSRLVDSRLATIGAARASVPQRGAIAVVEVAGDGGEHFGDEAGAILLGGSAALLSQTGLIVADVPIVTTWAL